MTPGGSDVVTLFIVDEDLTGRRGGSGIGDTLDNGIDDRAGSEVGFVTGSIVGAIVG